MEDKLSEGKNTKYFRFLFVVAVLSLVLFFWLNVTKALHLNAGGYLVSYVFLFVLSGVLYKILKAESGPKPNSPPKVN